MSELIESESQVTVEEKPKQRLGLFPGISNEDYQNGPGESSSTVKHAAKALKIYKSYRDGEIKFKETEATEMGTAIHSIVLEPNKFDDEYAISPPDIKRPTKTQLTAKNPAVKTLEQIEFWERFDNENTGKIIISTKMYDCACRVRDSIMVHPEAKDLFQNGEAESSGYYLDQDFAHGEGTNMLCRYRPDYRTDNYILDLKSCIDASKDGFNKAIGNLGYHISAAHYLAGDAACKGTDHRQFIFVAAEKIPPYMVAVYLVSEKDLELGFWIRRRALNAIKTARKKKEWPGYNSDVAIETQLPPYFHYEMELSKI